MASLQDRSRPTTENQPFFSELLGATEMTGQDATPEFPPGRALHLWHVQNSAEANSSIMPSNLEALLLQRQRSRKDQPKVSDAPTSPTASSSASQHSTETSCSAFDGVENCRDYHHPSKNGIPLRAPTAPAADRRRQISLHYGSAHHFSDDNRPPPNAPTGPAADRRQAAKVATVPHQTAPSHCQSFTWRSRQAALTDRFRKVQAEMERLGFGRSPAAPDTPEEYLKTILAEKERQIQRKAALVQAMKTKREQQKRARQKGASSGHTSGNEPASAQDPTSAYEPISGPELTSANSHPLYGADRCWNIQYTEMMDTPQDHHAEWPTLAMFKEAGRRTFDNRCLPLPNQHHVQDQAYMPLSDAAWEERESLSHQGNIIDLGEISILSLAAGTEIETGPACDIDSESLNDWTREIINEIVLEGEDCGVTTAHES
ncbi:hypothetical protein CORC01_11452 [Colletotrichum orchidophilum]|uniref:Uncharacterized protein n=1 Tax=Colletotrichum orchidophilum TaxID=1209926 RepID=A0A1G4AVN6_9PEZI|nr:uncharacterized protein CORC01_11452 [Colletotrichum orchidophilum]OHE93227.1 hypothetical protein CORC01_11452 [Colletotrichum orchidophilum]